jgi:hypothetical protein
MQMLPSTTARPRQTGKTHRRHSRTPDLEGRQRLLLTLRIVDGAIVYKADDDRTARNRFAHPFAERQRSAAFERCIDGPAVNVTYVSRRIVA